MCNGRGMTFDFAQKPMGICSECHGLGFLPASTSEVSSPRNPSAAGYKKGRGP